MKIIALIINLLGIVAIVFSVMAAMMSAMMFDAPGSENIIGLKIAFYCLVSMPLVLIITEVFAWKRFIDGNYWGAILAFKWVLLVLIILIISLFTTGIKR